MAGIVQKTLSDYTPEEVERARQAFLKKQERDRRQSQRYYREHQEERLEHMRQNYQETKEERATYRQEHQEEKREYNSQYYQENRGKILEQHAQYHRENKDKIRVQHAQHYQKNRSRLLEQVARYQREHPEVSRNRNARRRGADGLFTSGEWTQKLQEYDNKCVYCDTKVEDTPEGKLTIDHIVPIARGGTSYIDNLVPACLQCNMEKNAMTAEEFLVGIDAGNEEGVTVRRYISEYPEEAAKLYEESKRR